jgi:hypothetical protein
MLFIEHDKTPKTIPFQICGRTVEVKVVNDIFHALDEVMNGNIVARYEFGSSMEPILHNGEYAILIPKEKTTIEAGDAVFCEVCGTLMTHMVHIIKVINGKTQYLIGNSFNGETPTIVYGWTENIFAKAISSKHIQKEC